MKMINRVLWSIFILTISTICLISQVAAANTEYVYNGYHYYLNNNNMAVICDWESESTDFITPNMVSEYFVSEIDSFAFQNNEKITSLDFSQAKLFDTIGAYSFDGCKSIKGCLILPRKINFVGDAAFQNCSSLSEVTISANIDSVPRQCFKNCTTLKLVTINAGAKEIEAYSFENCTNLESITIPKTVTSINSTAFNGCTDFTIKGYRDSYAQKFAEDNGYEFEILDPLYGDANSDGKVNILDVTAIQRYKIGDQELSGYGMKCADVNKDGSVTIRDATLIQMKLAKYDVDF